MNNSSNLTLNKNDKKIIYVLILGVILPLLDTTLINLALNDIHLYFKVDISIVQWLTTGYMLAAATAVPLSSWLSQKITPKKTWILSLIIFLAGTLLGSIAFNIYILILARIIQGIGTGLLLPVMQTIIVLAVGREKTSLALSSMSIPSVLAPILGPFIAAILLQFFDWRSIFILHMPICIASIFCAIYFLLEEKINSKVQFDSIGFVTVSIGMVLFIFGLNLIGLNPKDTSLKSMAILCIGMMMLCFYVYLAKKKRQHNIIDITLFNNMNFKKTSILLFLSSLIYYAGILFYPLYLIKFGQYTVFLAGALVSIHGAGTLLGRKIMPTLTHYFTERNTIIISIAMSILGALLLLPPFITNWVLLTIGLLIRGFGVGILTILSMSGAYDELTKPQISHASTLTRILTYLGATIGFTIMSICLNINGIEGYLPHCVMLIATILCFFYVKSNQQSRIYNG